MNSRHGVRKGCRSQWPRNTTRKKMANSVVRYLVLNHKIPSYRIYVVGMGNAPVAAEDGTRAKHTSSGRVEISLLKNDLLSSAQH